MASADPTPDTPDPFSAQQSGAPLPEVAAERTALLAVDLVNDYVDAGGAMPAADTEASVANTARIADALRAAGGLVVWIRPGHLEAADGLFRKRIQHAMEGTWGSELHPGLGVREGERVVAKRRYSAFFATDLDLYLREHAIERVVVTGIALNICVRSTVHDAFFHGYDVWVAEDACRATGEREAASTLYDIQTHFGEVVSTDRVLEAWA